MSTQIEKQLKPFQEGIQRTKVKESYETITQTLWGARASIAHVVFHQGECWWEVPPAIDELFIPRMEAFEKALKHLHEQQPLPDFELLLSLDDCCDRPLYLHQTHVPIFSVSKKHHNDKVLLIPIGLFYPDREKQFRYMQHLAKSRPWQERKSAVLWQVETFNRKEIEFDWRLGPTLSLLYLSKHYPKELDFRMPRQSFVYLPRKIQHVVRDNGFIQKKLSLEDQAAYKYHLIFDQRAIPRDIESLMMLKPLLLMADMPYEMWFSPHLKESKCFIALDERCNDVLEKMQWCESNPKECEGVLANLETFCEEILSDCQVFTYFNALLRRYIPLM